MNWSMIAWAPLTKSPNCASQSTRLRGSAELNPYSNPSTASSDSIVFTKMIGAWSGVMFASGYHFFPFS